MSDEHPGRWPTLPQAQRDSFIRSHLSFCRPLDNINQVIEHFCRLMRDVGDHILQLERDKNQILDVAESLTLKGKQYRDHILQVERERDEAAKAATDMFDAQEKYVRKLEQENAELRKERDEAIAESDRLSARWEKGTG